VASAEYHRKALWGSTDHSLLMSDICKHFMFLVFSCIVDVL
jgi:hypothetical protein